MTVANHSESCGRCHQPECTCPDGAPAPDALEHIAKLRLWTASELDGQGGHVVYLDRLPIAELDALEATLLAERQRHAEERAKWEAGLSDFARRSERDLQTLREQLRHMTEERDRTLRTESRMELARNSAQATSVRWESAFHDVKRERDGAKAEAAELRDQLQRVEGERDEARAQLKNLVENSASSRAVERAELLSLELTASRAADPDDLRALGWAVAVHNDYRLNGEPHTFWLMTRDGRAVKGEGRTDAEALGQVRKQVGLPSPHSPDGRKVDGPGPLSDDGVCPFCNCYADADTPHAWRDCARDLREVKQGLQERTDRLERDYAAANSRLREAFSAFRLKVSEALGCTKLVHGVTPEPFTVPADDQVVLETIRTIESRSTWRSITQVPTEEEHAWCGGEYAVRRVAWLGGGRQLVRVRNLGDWGALLGEQYDEWLPIPPSAGGSEDG
jgi:predicted  nucleic acid-binding Zn-ribbon protein